MTCKIDVQADDDWNKEYPDDKYTYQECEKALTEGCDAAAWDLFETLMEKLREEDLDPAYFDLCGDAVKDTQSFDSQQFNGLVCQRVRDAINNGMSE